MGKLSEIMKATGHALIGLIVGCMLSWAFMLIWELAGFGAPWLERIREFAALFIAGLCAGWRSPKYGLVAVCIVVGGSCSYSSLMLLLGADWVVLLVATLERTALVMLPAIAGALIGRRCALRDRIGQPPLSGSPEQG